jgi:hypothetical protein
MAPRFDYTPEVMKVDATLSLEACLPFGLEVARQLHDARRALPVETLLLHWDDESIQAPRAPHILKQFLVPFLTLGALRGSADGILLSSTYLGHGCVGTFFLPRRRQRLCVFHKTMCHPTRETPEHRLLALDWYQQALASTVSPYCPTFLVDLLDPWPRDMTVPEAKKGQRPKIPDGLRYFIFERDGFQCRLCGASVHDATEIRLHVGHKIARIHGGTDTPENLITLCSSCNQGMAMQDLKE